MPVEKFRSICSAVDKLDKVRVTILIVVRSDLSIHFQKMKWEDVRKEMIEDKGLDGDKADLIGQYVQQRGGKDLVDRLMADALLKGQPSAQEGLVEMGLLLHYCDLYGVLDKV